MTVTLPDGALAAAIAAIATAIVWAIRYIAKAHVDTLKEQSNSAKDIHKLVVDLHKWAKQAYDGPQSYWQQHQRQLARMRRALQRFAPQSLVCEECLGWWGELNQMPDGLEPCRCSEPSGSEAVPAPVAPASGHRRNKRGSKSDLKG